MSSTPTRAQVSRLPSTPLPVPKLVITPSTPLKIPIPPNRKHRKTNSSQLRCSLPPLSISDAFHPSSTPVEFSYDEIEMEEALDRGISEWHKRRMEEYRHRSKFLSIFLFVFTVILVVSSAAISTSPIGLGRESAHSPGARLTSSQPLDTPTRFEWIGSKVGSILTMNLWEPVVQVADNAHHTDEPARQEPTVTVVSSLGDDARGWVGHGAQSFWRSLRLRMKMAAGIAEARPEDD